MPVEDALKLAEEKGFDLVLVAEQSTPPVCRLMNYGKFTYEKKKQVRGQKKKQHKQKNKEIKFHANIDPHDYEIKVNRIKHFLQKGCRVKVSLFFRGRELRNTEKGMELMEQVKSDITSLGVVDSQPKMVGRNISMHIVPISHK